MAIRRAAVAGTWYPGKPDALVAQVNGYLAAATVDPIPRPRAVIAPHAGLMYSGPVAAHAYAPIRDAEYDTVVLVGPSHFVAFDGVSVWRSGQWETPFGFVDVDESLAAAIASQSSMVRAIPEAHGREHALELQLPFVAHLFPHARIVPLVMGHQIRETAFTLGDALARAVSAHAASPRPMPHTPTASGESSEGRHEDDMRQRESAASGHVLLVASSDLSHYQDARTAASLDAVVLRHVEALDAERLMGTLEREPRHACGGGPMVAVLHAARQLGATQARVLQYADSGDVSGDKSSVVGYMAAAMW